MSYCRFQWTEEFLQMDLLLLLLIFTIEKVGKKTWVYAFLFGLDEDLGNILATVWSRSSSNSQVVVMPGKKLLKRKQRTIRNDNNTKIKTHHSKEIHLRNTKLSRSQLKENHHEILSKQSMENYLKDTERIRRKFSS